MKDEITLDDIPAPGEPLLPARAPENEQLLQDELQERKQRISSILSKKEYRRALARYKRLHKQLNRKGYNDLIRQRWEVYQRCQELIYQHSQGDPSARIEGLKLKKRGQRLNEQIAKLSKLSSEFQHLSDRLSAHHSAMDLEVEERENRKAFLKEIRAWENQIKAVFRQSARLHHRGVDSRGNEFTRIPKIERIIFKEDRVLYQIQTAGQNVIERAMGKWHSALPYNVDIADLVCQETLDNLSAACNRIVTVERSKRGTNLFYAISRLDSPDGIPKKLSYSKALNWYPTEQHEKTPWIAGVSSDRRVISYTFEDQPHVLIAGSTQSGKSNHVNQMIATLVSMNAPDAVRLILIDNKGGIEFTHWQGSQHLLMPMIRQPAQVLPALENIRNMLNKRLDLFESVKAKKLSDYNKRYAPLPRIVVFIDEMATLLGLGDLTTAIHNELRVISSQGRAVGIHLVICTQHSSVDVLPGWVKTNMTLRISGKMPSHQASMVILDSVSAASLPNIPGRMVVSEGRFETIVQSPLITDAEIALSVKVSGEYPPPAISIEPEVKAERFGRAELLKIVFEVYSGKLSPKRIHDQIDRKEPLSKIRKIVDQIVADGEIEYEGQLYRVKAMGNSHVLNPVEPELEDEDTEEVPILR